MNHVLRKGASLARLGIPGMALVCLVQGCARKDRAAGLSPIDTTNPASTAATTTTSGAPMDTSLRPLDELTDADKSSAPRRVRLLGLTEPAKDMPQLRVRGARVELGGAFDEHLWEHHDRLVLPRHRLQEELLRALRVEDDEAEAPRERVPDPVEPAQGQQGRQAGGAGEGRDGAPVLRSRPDTRVSGSSDIKTFDRP